MKTIRINNKTLPVAEPSPRWLDLSMTSCNGWRCYLGRGTRTALKVRGRKGYSFAISMPGKSLAAAQSDYAKLKSGDECQIEFVMPNGYWGWLDTIRLG